LRISGAIVCYNNEVHGKVLLVDDLIAVVSSFNLLKNPASGLSWEAGIITYESEVIKSINDSVNKMIDQT
jgi:phosphatidylserine/phosphatidylglycerophosphate/cardiolipin synthase-like enzyme